MMLAIFTAGVKAGLGAAYVIEAAMPTAGTAAADILGQANQQGMIFIEQSGISGQVIHKEALISRIAIAIRGYAESAGYTASVSINNKCGLVGGIEYYGVGCLVADTVNGEELFTEMPGVFGK